MLKTFRSVRGAAVAPHALAAQSGLDILREGGNAAEATLAMAASLAVLYPHMSGIGGDSFWLLYEPGGKVSVIDAAGRSALDAHPDMYLSRGLRHIPTRGMAAVNTVAGTVAGWQAAFHHSKQMWSGRIGLSRLLDDAIYYAENGYPVSAGQAQATERKLRELKSQPGAFGSIFLDAGEAPLAGELQCQKQLGSTLRYLSQAGLWDFYRGELARAISHDLRTLGSPVRLEDLQAHQAIIKEPLILRHSLGKIYNTPAPTQGIASLLILGLFDALRQDMPEANSAGHIHLLVEAAKTAFSVRDKQLHRRENRKHNRLLQTCLENAKLKALANGLNLNAATPWQGVSGGGDTAWFGAIDSEGRAVSAIQSLYYEFGSGVVLPGSGICWQNRGCSFSLDKNAVNLLQPQRKPFHTLNPALAELNDGRVMVYGCMGGDGQPQVQSALFTRYVNYSMDLQEALNAPRWLLGRAWGETSNTLKLENRFPMEVLETLANMGHPVEVVGAYEEIMGHAGAVVRHANGVYESATDPRSDGAATGY